MEVLEERVHWLETLVGEYIVQERMSGRRIDQMIARMDQTSKEQAEIVKRLDAANQRQAEANQRQAEANQRMAEEGAKRDQAMDEFRRRAEADRIEAAQAHREFNQQMAHIADRVGRFAEDIVAPNIPRLAREVFGISTIQFFSPYVLKRHIADPSKLREFDVILAGDGKLIVSETKATARVKSIDDFAEGLEEVFDYFPEYDGFQIIPIFASMSLSPDFIRRLTNLRIYALALGDSAMDLLNYEDVQRPSAR